MKKIFCDFCEKCHEDAGHIVASQITDAAICNECIDISKQLCEEAIEKKGIEDD